MVNDINIFFRLRVPIIKKTLWLDSLSGEGGQRWWLNWAYLVHPSVQNKSKKIGTHLLASSSETDTTVRVRVSVDA